MRLKILSLVAGALLLSASAASAAVVTRDLNLRSGPGTGYQIIGTMPAGAQVVVLGCGGAWCRVNWRGTEGFASSHYIAEGGGYVYGPAYPPAIVVTPGFGGYYYGGRRYYGNRHYNGGYRGGQNRRGSGGAPSIIGGGGGGGRGGGGGGIGSRGGGGGGGGPSGGGGGGGGGPSSISGH
jgi:uncharacterized protein YraI